MDAYARHRAILVSIPLSVAIILRLYPYFLYGVPWGTDAWPLIRNANELLLHSPTTLGGNPVFDSYNIYWPAASLFGATGSLIFGIPAIEVISIMVPLAAALATLFFFLIAERLTKNSLVACIASLFFASAGFDAIFTASATKETFAYPFFALAILILLIKVDVKSTITFALVSITLALSHHVTTLILLTIVGAIVVSDSILSFAGYTKPNKRWIFPLVIAIIFALDYELFAKVGWANGGVPLISIQTIIPAVALFVISLTVSTYFSISQKVRSMLVEGIIIVCVGLVMLYVSTQTSILPFAPILPILIAVLALPYLGVGFFGVFGYKIMHNEMDKTSFAFASSWFAATLALLVYTVIGTPNGVFLIYRLFTFVYAPVAIFAALALVSLFGSRKVRFFIARRTLLVAIVVGIVLASSYMSYASVVGKENLLAGHYAYTQSDFASAQFVGLTLPSNSTLASDYMISDLYSSYFGISVNVNQGYKYLQGVDQLGLSPSEMLLTYSLMSTQGYDLNIYGFPIPTNWSESLSKQSSLVFNNGNEMIWR